jgi:hypothetical protein
MTPTSRSGRQPIRGLGIVAAPRVREAVGYAHPAELEIEVLAWIRGALVRPSVATGARANLLRLGDRGVIGVADNLGFEERRWAIAHELGHFEAHAGVSFVGLCSSRDMLAAYEASGREPEANAFAAELLMPEDLFAKRCDVAKVSWTPVRELADEFAVSVTAAALRFIACTDERVCLVCAKDGVISWSAVTKNFGSRPRRNTRIKPWTESYAFFDKNTVETKPQTVSASAWIDDADDDEDLVEHVFAIPRLRVAMSLLWRNG